MFSVAIADDDGEGYASDDDDNDDDVVVAVAVYFSVVVSKRDVWKSLKPPSPMATYKLQQCTIVFCDYNIFC